MLVKITKNWFLTSFLVYFVKIKITTCLFTDSQSSTDFKIFYSFIPYRFFFSDSNHPSYRDRTTKWLYELLLPAWLLKFLIQKNKKKKPLWHIFFLFVIVGLLDFFLLFNVYRQNMRAIVKMKREFLKMKMRRIGKFGGNFGMDIFNSQNFY